MVVTLSGRFLSEGVGWPCETFPFSKQLLASELTRPNLMSLFRLGACYHTLQDYLTSDPGSALEISPILTASL